MRSTTGPVAAVIAALALGAVPAAAGTPTATQSYTSPGAYTFVVPPGVTSIAITAVGAPGGVGAGSGGPNSPGGSGVSVADDSVSVTPGEQLTAIVGSPGGSGVGTAHGGSTGPFGGGGVGGAGVSGGGGGGASSVYTVGSGSTPGVPLVIAGGGGGGGGEDAAVGEAGGNAGGSSGSTGKPTVNGGGGGGTNTTGGAGGSSNLDEQDGGAGSLGAGGEGGVGTGFGSSGGGGGGGGYFGGGGGDSIGADSSGGGGGGGSSYVVSGTLSATVSTAAPSVTLVYAAPAVSESPTGFISFGNTEQGTASAEQTVSLTNTGSVPLEVTGTSLSGADPGDYLIRNSCTQLVPAGASCQIGVRFVPESLGASSAAFAISTNAGTQPGAIGLSGIGIAAPIAPPKLVLVAFAASVKHGKVTVSYALTGAAKVSLSVTPPHGKAVAVAHASGHAGVGKISWNGKLKGKRAKHGRYKLVVIASNGGKPVSSTVSVQL